MVIFQKISKISENPKLANTARSQQLNLPQIQKCLTLRGVELHAVLASVEFCMEQFSFAGLPLP